MICKNKTCIPTNFILVKNLTNQMIIGNPFLNDIFPLKNIDTTGFTGTYNGKEIKFDFISQPFTRVIS